MGAIDSAGGAVLAIRISFTKRCSDADDLILNNGIAGRKHIEATMINAHLEPRQGGYRKFAVALLSRLSKTILYGPDKTASGWFKTPQVS